MLCAIWGELYLLLKISPIQYLFIIYDIGDVDSCPAPIQDIERMAAKRRSDKEFQESEKERKRLSKITKKKGREEEEGEQHAACPILFYDGLL